MSLIILKNYNLFIDSSQRDEGSYPSYFNILLRKPIVKTNKNSVFRVRIPSVVIPFSFNQINSTNNILSYTYNSNPFTITIPSGNYNITDLLTEISSLIILASPTVLNLTYDVSTSKCTLGFGTGNLSNQSITMNYTGGNIILMKMLGFTSNITFSFNFGTGLYTNATSNQVVNVSPSKTLFIRSETLTQNTNYEALVSKNDTTDILLQIPIQTSYNTYINWYDQSSDLFAEINNVVIDKINLYLTDATSYNELPADSGLLNWFIQLNIQEIYIPTDINTEHITTNNIITNKQVIKDVDKIENEDDIENKKNILKKEINDLIDKKKL